MAISDWAIPPTVEGRIVFAWSEGADVLHVQPEDVADDIGNLMQAIGDPDDPSPDPMRPFLMTGLAGMIAAHGYPNPADALGKRCLLHSYGRYDSVRIEKPDEPGKFGDWLIWVEYV